VKLPNQITDHLLRLCPTGMHWRAGVASWRSGCRHSVRQPEGSSVRHLSRVDSRLRDASPTRQRATLMIPTNETSPSRL
jgi:hypothetical protein